MIGLLMASQPAVYRVTGLLWLLDDYCSSRADFSQKSNAKVRLEDVPNVFTFHSVLNICPHSGGSFGLAS